MPILLVLSPAKTLDSSIPKLLKCSQPHFKTEANTLVKQLKKISKAKLKSFFKVSDAIAALNHKRSYQWGIDLLSSRLQLLRSPKFFLSQVKFQDFNFDLSEDVDINENIKQAVYSFNGPAYQGLDANSFSSDDIEFAQGHLRILCGLYGILKPLDIIQPYRLEMGQKLETSRGGSLYDFWGGSISEFINKDISSIANSDHSEKIILNVASNEYSKSIDHDVLDSDIRVINCIFRDDGRIKSVYAKKARGLMCRYVIKNQVDDLDGIKQFDLEGYKYSEVHSTCDDLVFNRSKSVADKLLSEQQKKRNSKNSKENKNPKRIKKM